MSGFNSGFLLLKASKENNRLGTVWRPVYTNCRNGARHTPCAPAELTLSRFVISVLVIIVLIICPNLTFDAYPTPVPILCELIVQMADTFQGSVTHPIWGSTLDCSRTVPSL